MVILLVIFSLFLSNKVSYGVNEFTTTQEIIYQFDETGLAQVNHKISIINNFSQFYPTEYQLSISASKATDIRAFDSNGNLPIEAKPNSDEVQLSLDLPNAKVGKDQSTSFNINYRSVSLAHKKGKTWEVILPQIQDSLSNATNLTITVPTSFGKLASSPPGANIYSDHQNAHINFKNYNSKDKLILTFGEYQLFNFDLNYYLRNDSQNSGLFSIPVPPDTPYQKVLFNKIEPRPQEIKADIDGNWLAYFQIPPNSHITVQVSGQAKIGQNPNVKYSSAPILESQLYWPVDNPEIIKLARIHTTPRQIYDYVVSSLSYDFNRINDSKRHGALRALQNPNSSLCTDFTDLFVSIARAAGIGSREIEGYAYSNNIDIKPLLVGTDVLHAWPEYYNNKTKEWVPIDPTWGKTTGGINYFDDLDLNHLTFVIHNQRSDSPPPPGSYKNDPNQKSVNVSFADSEITPEARSPIFSVKFSPFSQSTLIVTNPNLFSLDNFSLSNQTAQNILPLAKFQTPFPKTSFVSSLFPRNQKQAIVFSYNNQPQQTMYIQNPYHFFNLSITIISSLILLSIGAIILLHKK